VQNANRVKKVEHIIFDMDGTLIDSSDVIVNSINYVREKLNLSPLKKDIALEVVNDPSVNSPKFFYHVEDYKKEHIIWFQEYYTLHHKEQVRLYDGIVPMLDKFKKTHKLSIATNAYRKSALQIIEHLNIEDYFEIIVCADDVEKSKPHPDSINKIINHYEADISSFVVVGDSVKDEQAAIKAGVKSILVDWGFSDIDGALQNVTELEQKLQNI
jgi:phosphoglycolate phosphatase